MADPEAVAAGFATRALERGDRYAATLYERFPLCNFYMSRAGLPLRLTSVSVIDGARWLCGVVVCDGCLERTELCDTDLIAVEAWSPPAMRLIDAIEDIDLQGLALTLPLASAHGSGLIWLLRAAWLLDPLGFIQARLAFKGLPQHSDRTRLVPQYRARPGCGPRLLYSIRAL